MKVLVNYAGSLQEAIADTFSNVNVAMRNFNISV